MSATSSALAAAALLGAGVLLIREAKDVIPDVGGAVADSGAAAGQTKVGQAVLEALRRIKVGIDQTGRTITAAKIEAGRVGSPGFGSVSGSIGTVTGIWSQSPEQAIAGRCQAMVSTRFASGGTKFFTGGYCRRAADLGLI
jgi:hypothetical protein